MYSKYRSGFTLLEILLVVAAIGILAAIIVVAINPQRQLGKVRDAERQSEVTTIQDAIEQYAIANDGTYPSDIKENTYTEICDTDASGVTSSDCTNNGYVDLSDLVPNQLASIPRDPQADSDDAETGYQVAKDGNGNIAVKAPDTEEGNTKRTGTVPVKYSVASASYDKNKVWLGENIPQGVTFNSDGTKMFVIGASSENIHQYDLSTGYDVTTASYNQRYDIYDQANDPRGMSFNSDGTKMFVIGISSESVHEYDLSTGYDISTASYTGGSYDVSSQSSDPRAVTFNSDGTKMFIVGEENESVYEYDLSTGYDVSTASFNQSYDVSGEATDPQGLVFNSDGSKMLVMENSLFDDESDNVYRYDLSTGYDVSTASYTGKSYDVNGQDSGPTGVTFNSDGKKMIVVGKSNDNVYRYDLSTGYDVSTASYNNENYDVSGQVKATEGVTFNSDGTKMFVVGKNSASVHQYDLSTKNDLSTASFNQSYDVSGESSSPKGVAFNSDGTRMFVVGILNDSVYRYDLSTGYDISTASYIESYDVSGQVDYPSGLTFNSDGTKMFVVENDPFSAANYVYEYDLSTGYDLGTASYTQNYDVSGEESSPTGIAFSSDGTKMFVIGTSNDSVYEYDLSTGYDVSTASYTGDSYDVSNQDIYPEDVTFNPDGVKMFVLGTSFVYRYRTSEE